MKILWAKSGGLLPLDTGGKIRSFNIARELSRRHEVTLFTFYPSMASDPHDQLRDVFAGVECMPLNLPERGSAGDMLAYTANAFSARPYQMRKYCRPEAARRLRKLLVEGNYDVLLCDFLLTAGVVPWDIGIPTVVFTHNVEAVIWHRHFLLNKNPFWKMIAWREYQTIARAEKHFTELADHVLTVSDDDRKTFLEFLPEESVTTVPTGVDLDYFGPLQPDRSGHSLVFTGSMDWMPNEDAIIYFANEVLPLIQQKVPDTTLCVVGRKPTAKVLALNAKNPAIHVTGAVEDIRTHVSDAAVYVVPLRVGGGTRIKIFEAMAMAMPVVSTSIGAEGLPVNHGENILLADTPAQFADCTVNLLKQPMLRKQIGRSARTLVESRYSWASVTDVLENVLERVARTKSECVLTY